MSRFAQVLFGLTGLLTAVVVFHYPEANPWPQRIEEALAFAALFCLAGIGFKTWRIKPLFVTLVGVACGAQLVQFSPQVPGTPSVADWLAAVSGLVAVPLLLALAIGLALWLLPKATRERH
ncbi:hypothetical protein BH09PSE2_BH09PSE2_05850 [soil metagenome]